MKVLTVRVDDEFYEVLEIKAKNKKTSISELVRNVIEDDLEKDIDFHNEIISTFGLFKSDLLNLKREMNVFSSMFMYWLRFYFTLSGQDFDSIPEGKPREIAFEKGEERRDKFLQLYKRENKQMKSLFEQLFADYAVKEKEE